MDDGELLRLLAAEAPGPRPDLADEVIARGRRARARRRWKAAAGGLALAASVTVAVPLVLHQVQGAQELDSASKPALHLEEGERPDALREHYDQAPAPSAASPEARPGASGEFADVYAAALEAFLAYRRTARPVRVLDRVCPLRGECTDRPLDGALKDALSLRMPSVRFVQPPLEGAQTDKAAEPLRLGEVRVEGLDGGRARVPVSGKLLRLELREGRWRVVDGL